MPKETVLNYEVEMIDYQSDGLSKPNTSLNYQYTVWQLNDKIHDLMGSSPNTVRWIGNGDSSYLDSFVYVLMSISLKNESLILKLKEGLYGLSKRYLQKSNQKLIVQFLCLIQYTKDKYNFLRKYPDVTKMIVSILKFYENQVLNKQNFKVKNLTLESPLRVKRKECFQIFCSMFDFISVTHPNQYTYRFKSQDQILYLILEKDFFFIVQENKILEDQRENSIQKKQKRFKNSTPRFCGLTNTLNKLKDRKKNHQNHLIHQNNKSENLLDLISNSSQDCSIQEIQKNLKLINVDDSPHKKLDFDKLKMQQLLRGRNQKSRKLEGQKKENANSDNLIKKLRQTQQKRQQLWKKLQEQYYQKKQLICKKISQNKIHRKNLSGLDSGYYQSEYDKKSTTKSYQGTKKPSTIKLTKVSQRQSPNEMVNRKHSNQNIINQQNRLSIIQEENPLKFWNSLNRKNIQANSPNIKSMDSSNQETLDGNTCVAFDYINKDQHNYSTQNTPKPYLHKVWDYGPPLRVYQSR